MPWWRFWKRWKLRRRSFRRLDEIEAELVELTNELKRTRDMLERAQKVMLGLDTDLKYSGFPREKIDGVG